jgi:acyl phosphate:glycerol-3-phosphate acyltransferase
VIDILKTVGALAFGYLLGSLNTSVLVGKMYGKDVSALGSRNAGLTNTLRVLGKSAAALVLVGDIMKAVVACWAGLLLGVFVASGAHRDCVSLLAAGAGAFMGHNWPVYFGFKGGKGMLTAAAVMLMIDWPAVALSFAVFVAVVALTRYVSLGTLCAAVFFVALSFAPVFGNTVYFQIFACLMAMTIVLKHRENIQRLLSGTENKLAY